MSASPILAFYRIRSPKDEIAARVDALLLEQTVELPRSCLTTAFVRESIVGRVLECSPAGHGEFRVVLEQPAITAAGDPAQLLNVLFGNSSLQPDVELEDVEIPPGIEARVGGPRFGIEGLRRITGVHGRALTASAIKPMGLSAGECAALCGELALGGIDVIKDDHGLADHAFCPFPERVRLCLEAADRAADRTGRRAVYVPNLIGTPALVREQAVLARELGAQAVMVSPMLLGLPFMAELAGLLGAPILAHPAFGGAQRISPLALLGRLFPVYGADAVIYPNAGGRFSYSADTCAAVADALRGRSDVEVPVLPVPAGGMRTSGVADALRAHGRDVMLLLGGSLLEPSLVPLAERCRQFAKSVESFPYPS